MEQGDDTLEVGLGRRGGGARHRRAGGRCWGTRPVEQGDNAPEEGAE